MKHTTWWTPLLSIATLMIALPLGSCTSYAQVTATRTVSVSGMGTVHVLPDQATVRFGVVSVHDDAEFARALNAKAAAKSMDSIKRLNVEERKIKLDVLRLEPNRVFDEQTRRTIEKGFRATREVSVELEDLDLLPQLIANVVGEGANRIQGITYGLQDQRKVELEAIELAIVDAKSRADVMVRTLDAKLGIILSIAEQGVSVPRPALLFERAISSDKMQSNAATPEAFASGEIEVTANVTLVFAIN